MSSLNIGSFAPVHYLLITLHCLFRSPHALSAPLLEAQICDHEHLKGEHTSKDVYEPLSVLSDCLLITCAYVDYLFLLLIRWQMVCDGTPKESKSSKVK